MTTPTTAPTYPSIAAIVPCHNEAIAIGKVVEDLRKHLPPDATVYVYDNNSTDGTDEVAREAGAVVRYEPNKGKGNVIRRAFADIDADVYLMIDGDDTYEVSAAPDMIAKLFEGPYDHVLGVRRQVADGAYRPGHDLGNRMFNVVVKQIFEVEVRDMLSGYRIFSRRFVKSFPAVSREFEIETELTVHAANLRVPQVEMEVDFRDRPDGAVSKLRTYRDGWKILTLILHLARVERPVLFHSVVAGALGGDRPAPRAADLHRVLPDRAGPAAAHGGAGLGRRAGRAAGLLPRPAAERAEAAQGREHAAGLPDDGRGAPTAGLTLGGRGSGPAGAADQAEVVVDHPADHLLERHRRPPAQLAGRLARVADLDVGVHGPDEGRVDLDPALPVLDARPREGGARRSPRRYAWTPSPRRSRRPCRGAATRTMAST